MAQVGSLKIAEALGLPVGHFFGANDGGVIERRGTASSPLKLLTVPGALRLLQAYGKINDGKIRRSLIGMVENIAAGRR